MKTRALAPAVVLLALVALALPPAHAVAPPFFFNKLGVVLDGRTGPTEATLAWDLGCDGPTHVRVTELPPGAPRIDDFVAQETMLYALGNSGPRACLFDDSGFALNGAFTLVDENGTDLAATWSSVPLATGGLGVEADFSGTYRNEPAAFTVTLVAPA
ncbi:MAG: hypothetical protein ACYDCK_04485 [Thermoplasmatota archaeon]